ncbi:MAG: helix-turn-helix domain-containing protein [Myxococcaceae bacterium]
MKSFREQTYYELLEVERSSPAEQVRAALRRALEACAPDSVALYALVDEEQAEALRGRLQEAARVLLDPAARAGYDRMLGLEPEAPAEDASLWAEDEDEEAGEEMGEAPEVGLATGPYPRTEPAQLEQPPSHALGQGAQSSLPLETPPAPWASPGLGRRAAQRPPGLPSPAQRPSAALEQAAAAEAGPRPEEMAPPSAPAPERPRMPELPPDVEFNGELLRQVREARGLTLQQLAERTRIGRSHLERVEADRYADLPPSVYLRGILVNLARELKLDATRVSKSYLLLAARSGRPDL